MKNRLVAEARFLRGYFYFELVKNFGGVPLITGFLLPEEIQGITRASAEDVYKFIEDDLKAAADVLPQRSQYAATDMGRATRGAALGLLGKVYLYQSKWQEAHDVLKQSSTKVNINYSTTSVMYGMLTITIAKKSV